MSIVYCGDFPHLKIEKGSEHFLWTRPCDCILLLLHSSFFTTLSSSCVNFSCNCHLTFSLNPVRSSLELLHAPSCPIFTSHQSGMRILSLQTVFPFPLMVYLILVPVDRQVMNMSSICWIKLMKYGSLMEKNEARCMCHFTECFIRRLFLCSDS